MTIWKNHVTAEAPAAVARHTLNFHRKRFQENVLDGTKREYYDTWSRKNVLGGTKSW